MWHEPRPEVIHAIEGAGKRNPSLVQFIDGWLEDTINCLLLPYLTNHNTKEASTIFVRRRWSCMVLAANDIIDQYTTFDERANTAVGQVLTRSRVSWRGR